MSSTLLWLNNDLRIHDNAALALAAEYQQPLICLFCVDIRWLKNNRYGNRSMSDNRWQFLSESLADLQTSLIHMEQQLYIVPGLPTKVISQVIEAHDVSHIIRSQHCGYYENRDWLYLKNKYSKKIFCDAITHTLFNKTQLGLEGNLPSSFTKFRKHVDNLELIPTIGIRKVLPSPLRLDIGQEDSCHLRKLATNAALPFKGGETNGLIHLNHYFSSNHPSTYKETRNALDEWSSSCKLSPWLANGSLSVRTVVNKLMQYEKEHGTNDSTEWIFFELLWREYFQWYAHQHQKRLFAFKGIGKKRPLTSFCPQRFKQWCQGQTNWPIVNACIKQLNHTGYLSNRGRQLVASCLVNELSLDWRCGAAYFEQQLIDYDVASNWGNWQYIAGVGADPRGGRHFNLDKQTNLYDPQKTFIRTWDKDIQPRAYLDAFDAADWPDEPSDHQT